MDVQILLEKFCDYSLYIKGYSKDTIRRYRFVVGRYCRFADISEISQVNEDNVRRLFYWGRAVRNWSPNTFIVYRKSLLVFFRWCIKEGCLDSNPATDIEMPRLHKKKLTNLTRQEASRLLEIVYNYPYEYKFLRYRNHALFATAIFAGLRKQELLNLKLGDVDIENLTIFVRQGKGAKDRIIPMSYTLAQSLRRYVIERKRLHKTTPEFFCSLRGNERFTVNGLKHLVTLIRSTSKVSFTVHQLRHTFATLMLEGGCDIYALSKMMGHSDIKTTTEYLNASAEFSRKEMTKHPLNNLQIS